LLAERVHLALVDLSNGSSTFTGCDSSRRPLQGHWHAYIFCESNEDSGSAKGKHGKITKLTVYSRYVFGHDEVSALQRLERIWGLGDLEVRLALLEMGSVDNFADISPLFGLSRKWVSCTSFLPGRHAKRTRAGVPKCDDRGLQKGGQQHELLRLLELAWLPKTLAVESVAGTHLDGSFCGRGAEAGLLKPIWISDRVFGGCAGASGGRVCEPLRDGGI